MEDKAIGAALGLESGFGYHIEEPPESLLGGLVRERSAAPWYPCLAADGTYSGCLGTECPLEVCWTGGQSVSYIAALRTRFQPSDVEYVRGGALPAVRSCAGNLSTGIGSAAGPDPSGASSLR